MTLREAWPGRHEGCAITTAHMHVVRPPEPKPPQLQRNVPAVRSFLASPEARSAIRDALVAEGLVGSAWAVSRTVVDALRDATYR